MKQKSQSRSRQHLKRVMTGSNNIHIRRATARDLEVLVRHRHDLFETLHHIDAESHIVGDRAYRTFLLKMLGEKRFAAFLAVTKKGTPIASGCVWLREIQPFPARSNQTRTPYLMSMYTSPEYRGIGLATRIVKEAMRWSKKRGFSRMSLHASRMERPLYKKMGWRRTWEMRIDL